MSKENKEQEIKSKEGVHIWNAIDGEMLEVDNLEDALKWVKENFTDPEEGIHPDIDSIEIFTKIADVVVRPVPGKNTHRVELSPASQFTPIASKEVESDAVEFAEWAASNYIYTDKGIWFAAFGRKKSETTEQLYKLFKEKKH